MFSMNGTMQKIYQRYNKMITSVIFPLVLFFYPLIKVNQGLDLTDTTYSLVQYTYFPQMSGTWIISTYVSNIIGYAISKLPFGNTLLGFNCYTGLLVSVFVLSCYIILKKYMPNWIVFLGEWIAIGFCWIPTTILYNYLTYIFFAIGILFLYKGLVEKKNRFLFLAGVSLGINLFVRIPNVIQVLLILPSIYYMVLEKEKMENMVKKIGICIGGFLLGVFFIMSMIVAQYGISGIFEMVTGLMSLQEADDTYTLFSMIQSVVNAYTRTFFWVSFLLAGIAMGMAMFSIAKTKYITLKKSIYICGILILFRFFWGRGMFSFRYYEDYSSMFEWGMVGLYLSFIAIIILIMDEKNSNEEKVLGAIGLCIILITPLGSNNYTMQNLNNLFLLAPITIYQFVKLIRRKRRNLHFVFPWKCMIVAVFLLITVQSIGFHVKFVFRDGMDGTKREYLLSEETISGIYTTHDHGIQVEKIIDEMKKMDTTNKEGIFFGNCPGWSYVLKIPPALENAWPDLNSYAVENFKNNLLELEENPIIFIQTTSNLSELGMEKLQILQEYMDTNAYQIYLETQDYIICLPRESRA